MKTANYGITKKACYSAYFTMSTVFCVPPLLLVTFHEMYDISWTLLGTLVLVNFCTQMLVDLFFSLNSKIFNVKKVAVVMPLITSLGMLVYALVPTFFPQHAYFGLVVGTVIFSVSSGLCEVFLSPTIAAIPSENPQREMTLLHFLYAVGIFTMIVFSTLSLFVIGNENWMYLVLLFAALPVVTSVMFAVSPYPEMNRDGVKDLGKKGKGKITGLTLCVLCIFFGASAENVMTNWISGFVESALNINKTAGDILGMAMFAIMLGTARLLYARFGKNITRTLILGMTGCAVCYFVAGITSNIFVAFLACIMVGFCSSMLWPGSLILMEEKVSGVGIAAYALMAAGGDLGSSVAPQLMGYVVDAVSVSDFAKNLSTAMSLSPEQIGMKAGMLISSLFPMAGVLLLLCAAKYFKKEK